MDEQLEVLRAICGEMKTLNGRVNATNELLEDLRTELKAEVGGLRTEVGGHRLDREVLRGRVERLQRHVGIEPR